jgi:uncharacterized membrane protein
VGVVSHDKFRFGLVAAAFCVSAFFFVRWPAILSGGGRIPPRGDFARIATSLTIPLGALVILLIFGSITKRDPLRANYERFRRTYEVSLDLAIVLAVGTHLLLLSLIMVLWSHIGRWISYVPSCLVGVVLVVAGNVLPRLRPNNAMGIRTRWTLEDEAVWMRTHRVGGYFLLVFGATLIAWTFVDFQGIWWVLGTGMIFTAAGLPLLSYFFRRRGVQSSPGTSKGQTG